MAEVAAGRDRERLVPAPRGEGVLVLDYRPPSPGWPRPRCWLPSPARAAPVGSDDEAVRRIVRPTVRWAVRLGDRPGRAAFRAPRYGAGRRCVHVWHRPRCWL